MSHFWIALLSVFAVLAGASAWLFEGRNRDVVSEIITLNPGGEAGTALVVYHPGKSDFQQRVFSSFADGLIARGWQVKMVSPSAQSPTDLDGYDLLVLGGPTYGFRPNRPIRRYLNRLGNLAGQRTVTIITALGSGERSAAIMERLVWEANGDLVKALTLYKLRPNDEDNYVDAAQNQDRAVEMAIEAATEIL